MVESAEAMVVFGKYEEMVQLLGRLAHAHCNCICPQTYVHVVVVILLMIPTLSNNATT